VHFKFRNVNDAFLTIVSGIHSGNILTEVYPSRAGEVMVIPEPVTITYTNPSEKVLFNRARDCNPFFHLYEALWMLAGRNDVAPLSYYNSQIADIASDDGKTFNGAYGYRWRHFTGVYPEAYPVGGVDQLKILIEHLRNNPWSRRAVLSMWNVEDDLLKVEETKDVCCNLNVHFLVRSGTCRSCDGTGRYESPGEGPGQFATDCSDCAGKPHDVPRYLDMTVYNRSNDLIWGSLGANVVHFAMLQEYVAGKLGLDVGDYHQFSDNLHAYTERWEPEKWLREYDSPTMHDLPPDPYEMNDIGSYLLGDEPDYRIQWLVDDQWVDPVGRDARDYGNGFLEYVALPMCSAFQAHKRRDYEMARRMLGFVRATDWRLAGTEWIERRQVNYERKQHGRSNVPACPDQR
jgi:thymidylate synthase